MSNRIQRINSLIKKQIAQLLLKEMDFPKDILVTVTRVETYANLRESKVYISAIPESQVGKVLRILEGQVYFLQQKLNQKLKMRPIPKIRFLEEKETVRAGKIEEILEELKKRENEIK